MGPTTRFLLALCCAVALCSMPLSAVEVIESDTAIALDAETLMLKQLDRAKVDAEDADADQKGRPNGWRVSIQVAHKVETATQGKWIRLSDGRMQWRYRVLSDDAVHLSFGFKKFWLPEGAELKILSANGIDFLGPYTSQDNEAHGELWTPVLEGRSATLELTVPAASMASVQLQLDEIGHGYRGFNFPGKQCKSGSCNTDVACLAADDPWQLQRRSVASYLLGGFTCTGSLLNNTSGDRRMLFMTASHCGVTANNARSMVFYWNFEAPTCRVPGSGASSQVNVGSRLHTQTGAVLLAKTPAVQAGSSATTARSDVTLLELDDPADPTFNLYWAGWDRGTAAPQCSVPSDRTSTQGLCASIHHPSGDEKRITFSEVTAFTPASINIEGATANGVHWQVNWDLTPPILPNMLPVPLTLPVSVTEGGSSGSPFYNQQHRLVGVLTGGASFCGRPDAEMFDYYGKIAHAWEGLGTADTRIRDYLDPLATGAVTLDGRGVCNAPQVNLIKDSANPSVDAAINFTASISGGSGGPYTVRWDIDGDGVVDRTGAQVAQSVTIPVHYPVATSTTVSAVVTDGAGCATTRNLAIDVSAPDIVATASAPLQVCGDGDAVIEPGEHWRLPVQLTNTGGNGSNGAIAQFTTLTSLGSAVGPPGDAFGYRVIDSSASNSCRFQPVDMNAATIVAADDNDDGVTAALAVGGASPFRLYGQNVSQLYMSTNGYLSSNSDEDGGDFANVCDGFGSIFDNNARLHVLHDDMVLQGNGNLRHQRFATCPRAADVGGAQGCTVFQWSNLGLYTSASTAPAGNAVFQAILYDQSYEIVYQYLTADALAGGSATISIENAAQTDRLQYGCGLANQAPAGRAVCFFEPSALPGGVTAAPMSLVGAAQHALPNLASSQVATVSVPFAVPATAACGAPIGIRYVGTVDDFSSSNRSAVLYSGTLGNGAACQVSNACGVTVPPLAGAPRDGVFSPSGRSGNGISIHNIAVGNAAVPAGAWFSGRADRKPTWYLINGAWDSNDRRADLTFFQFRQSAPGVFPTQGTQVGSGLLTHDGAGNDYVMSWTIDGISRMDKLARTYGDANAGTAGHSGLWNTAGQSGWGVMIEDHVNGGAQDSFVVDYLYDASGAPTWLLGVAPNLQGQMSMTTYEVHCPWCPNFTDFANTASNGGTQTRTFSDAGNGIFGSTINAPATNTTWTRSNLPIRLLTTPQQ